MVEIYNIYDKFLHDIKILKNINVIESEYVLDDYIQFQFNGSLRIKISSLEPSSSLQIIENDGINDYVYDYNDGNPFDKAREFEFTVKGGYRYNLKFTNNTLVKNLQIFYRRE